VRSTDSEKGFSLSIPQSEFGAYSQSLANVFSSSSILIAALIDALNAKGGVRGELLQELIRLEAIYNSDFDRANTFIQKYRND
jgi:hypothetical protein